MIIVVLAGTTYRSVAAIDSYSQEFTLSSDIAGWTKIQEIPDTPVEWKNRCLIMNVQDTVAGNEMIGYTLGGTLKENETVKVKVRLINLHNNYYKGRIQLWNSTGNILLAESEEVVAYGAKDARYKPVDVKMTYTAVAEDEGTIVQIRVVENCNGSQRDMAIDSISISSSQ